VARMLPMAIIRNPAHRVEEVAGGSAKVIRAAHHTIPGMMHS
jgi:hypothetical protein